MKGWFLIDFISVLPLDLIFQYGSASKVIRFSRLGRIYRLLKVTKMARLLQTQRFKNGLAVYLMKLFKLGIGLERMLSLMITFIVV